MTRLNCFLLRGRFVNMASNKRIEALRPNLHFVSEGNCLHVERGSTHISNIRTGEAGQED